MNDKRFETFLRDKGDKHIPHLQTLFPSHQKRRSWRPLWVSLAAVLLVFLMLPFVNRTQTEASTLYLEFNPNLQITFDENWVVIGIQEELSQMHPWSLDIHLGQDLDTFILSYFNQAIENGFIDEDTHFLYDVVHPDDAEAQTLATAFEANVTGRFPTIIQTEQFLRGNMLDITDEDRSQAKANNMTVMRYRLIEEILSQDNTLDYDDLADVPLGLLRQQWMQNQPPRRPDQRPDFIPPRGRP